MILIPILQMKNLMLSEVSSLARDPPATNWGPETGPAWLPWDPAFLPVCNLSCISLHAGWL